MIDYIQNLGDRFEILLGNDRISPMEEYPPDEPILHDYQVYNSAINVLGQIYTDGVPDITSLFVSEVLAPIITNPVASYKIFNKYGEIVRIKIRNKVNTHMNDLVYARRKRMAEYSGLISKLPKDRQQRVKALFPSSNPYLKQMMSAKDIQSRSHGKAPFGRDRPFYELEKIQYKPKTILIR